MFPVCACLNLSVQAIRQIFDIQGSHEFLQNATSMEETTETVKFGPDYECRATANVRVDDNLKTAKALNLTIAQSVLYRADRVIK
jgi:hypothetical protein